MVNEFSYYAQHSVMTDPQHLKYLYGDLPDDVPSLCEIVQHLCVHSYDAAIYDMHFPEDRLREIDLRHAQALLQAILLQDARSLLKSRAIAKRIIVTCRDYALLLCSILRSKNIPARLRYGFTTYLYKNFYHDQVIVEYWHHKLQKWCWVDPRTSDFVIAKKKLTIDFDRHDIPSTRFLTAGMSWLQCQANLFNPLHFGAGTQKQSRGLDYVFCKLIQDLAALNKNEMLLWDYWGLLFKDYAELSQTIEKPLIDQIAKLTGPRPLAFDDMLHLYSTQPSLQVQGKILSLSPIQGTYPVALN